MFFRSCSALQSAKCSALGEYLLEIWRSDTKYGWLTPLPMGKDLIGFGTTVSWLYSSNNFMIQLGLDHCSVQLLFLGIEITDSKHGLSILQGLFGPQVQDGMIRVTLGPPILIRIGYLQFVALSTSWGLFDTPFLSDLVGNTQNQYVFCTLGPHGLESLVPNTNHLNNIQEFSNMNKPISLPIFQYPTWARTGHDGAEWQNCRCLQQGEGIASMSGTSVSGTFGGLTARWWPVYTYTNMYIYIIYYIYYVYYYIYNIYNIK